MSLIELGKIERGTIDLGNGVRYSWARCVEKAHHRTIDPEPHGIGCLMVWHDCTEPLSSRATNPGEPFGWRPTGVEAHILVSQEPLTITASVYWPDCCEKHGFITDGHYADV